MKKIFTFVVLLVFIFNSFSLVYASESTDVYSVKAGDYLWKIAKAHDTTWQELAEINNLENPNLIFAGQKLTMKKDHEDHIVLNNITKDLKGTVYIIKGDNVTLHTYVAPIAANAVNSHIIETKNQLTIIDTQFSKPLTAEFKTYVDSLGKNIDKVIVSHGHPDHFYGLEAFSASDLYGTASTNTQIAKVGPIFISRGKPNLGDLIPDEVTVPNNELQLGETTIDGVTIIFEEVTSTEAETMLIVKIPELKALIGSDIIYNNMHLFLGQNEFAGWINAIENIQADESYTMILGGHGKPSSREVLDKMITYLERAIILKATANTIEEYKEKIYAAFPEYVGNLTERSVPLLFK